MLANLAAHHPLDQWPLIANVMSCLQHVTKACTIQSSSMLSEIPGSYKSDYEVAVTMKVMVLWDVMSCTYPPGYTVSHCKRILSLALD
jgi:predicted cobalt transporter CbtA